MSLDLTKYRPYLDGFDLSEDQKTAMIEALWTIVESVTDLAYGVHSSQLIKVANDNDSTNKNNVIEFFQLAASDPVLDELLLSEETLAACNDNTPHTEQKEKEAGT